MTKSSRPDATLDLAFTELRPNFKWPIRRSDLNPVNSIWTRRTACRFSWRRAHSVVVVDKHFVEGDSARLFLPARAMFVSSVCRADSQLSRHRTKSSFARHLSRGDHLSYSNNRGSRV